MFIRSLSLAGLLAACALATAPAAHAQTPAAPDPAMAAQGQGQHRLVGRQGEMMKALNLTDDQKTKVEALMSENRAAMMNRPSGPPDAAQRDAMRARRADMETKMKAILTPEQYAQYTKYQAMRPQRSPQPQEL